MVFSATKTKSIIEEMNQRNCILLKEQVQKLSNTIVVLSSNYYFQGPNAYHDQALITKLSNDMRTLEAAIFIIEHNLQEDEFVEPFQVNPIEERTNTPPMYAVSSTPAHYPKLVPVSDAATSSLLSIREFSVVEEV